MNEQWHQQFQQVEQRIQQHLDMLRTHGEQMAELIREAELRRTLNRGAMHQ